MAHVQTRYLKVMTSNHRVKFVRFAHATALELRSFAALYAERWATP
jgi:hypothetical protein